jgi:hypothetical protein
LCQNARVPGPHDDPLGSRPTLPSPEGAGAKRARDLFRYLVKLERRAAEEGTLPGAPPPEEAFGGGRTYDRALAAIAAAVAEVPGAPESEETAVYAPPSEPEDEAPLRPPPGAPIVRPPARRRAAVEAVPQELLESTADSAMLVNDAEGTSFDISIRDDVFSELACRITVNDGKVIATFKVSDVNTRRLLEAESGRLRAQLEERGLTVAAIRVESE